MSTPISQLKVNAAVSILQNTPEVSAYLQLVALIPPPPPEPPIPVPLANAQRIQALCNSFLSAISNSPNTLNIVQVKDFVAQIEALL
jgi:hypothetical protein